MNCAESSLKENLASNGEKAFFNVYGRRQGRPLRPTQRQLLETLLPRLRLTLPTSREKINVEQIFGPQPFPLWLEIGFGGGEHLAAQAKANPHVHFIGAEFFINGVASLLTHISTNNLQNIRVVPGDARPLLDALPDQCLDRCFVLFPDPWPKKRHEARRFIGPDNLDRLARLLKPGAELRLATDDPVLLQWMLEQTRKHPQFQAGFQDLTECLARPDDWFPTRYEQKAIAAGRVPHFMIFSRR